MIVTSRLSHYNVIITSRQIETNPSVQTFTICSQQMCSYLHAVTRVCRSRLVNTLRGLDVGSRPLVRSIFRLGFMSAPQYEDKSLDTVYYSISYFLVTAVQYTQVALCTCTQLLRVRLSQIHWVYCFTNHWVTSRIPKTVKVTSGTLCTVLCRILCVYSTACVGS